MHTQGQERISFVTILKTSIVTTFQDPYLNQVVQRK